jgi:hypothetical protein
LVKWWSVTTGSSPRSAVPEPLHDNAPWRPGSNALSRFDSAPFDGKRWALWPQERARSKSRSKSW